MGGHPEGAYALDASHLEQNSSHREIHVEFVESPYLLWQIQAAVKDFSQDSTALRGAKDSEV